MSSALTVCTVATPDREPLLARMIDSLEVAAPVIVAGFGEWPPDALIHGASLRLVPGAFSLGRGRNVAANAAGAVDVLAFIDADMILPPGWLEWAAGIAAAGHIVAPQCWRLGQPGEPASAGNGWGNVILPWRYWRAVAGYVETDRYGGEDTAFIQAVRREFPDARLYRDQYGLLHQWHTKATAWHRPRRVAQ